MLDNFLCAKNRLLEVVFLAFTKLTCVLDSLFEPGDLSANLVVAALHLVELFGTFGLLDAGVLNIRFNLTLVGDGRFQSGLAL